MRTLGCLIVGIIALAVIVAIGAIIFAYTGWYNVSAVYKDNPAADWYLSNVTDHSVQRHARNIEVPTLDDPAKIRRGASLYSKYCVTCHGAPGTNREKVALALNPEPPALTEAAADWKPNEFYWITKNGVRMTGMPAWGKVIPDDQIWAITAFAQKLHTMKPAEYKALTAGTAKAK